MILSRIVRFSAFGLTFATLGFVGSASAASQIATTGPYSTNIINEQTGTVTTLSNMNNVGTSNYNNQNARSGSAFVGGNTSIGSGWESWDPMMWQNSGRSFGDWWNGMMGEMGTVTVANWGQGSNSSWTPSGSNWQATWSNWDPMMWRNNGATYGDWYGCMMSYMTSHHQTWMNNWGNGGNGGYGSASTGYAQNYNSTGNNVGITNNNSGYSNNAGGSGNGQGTIFLTGPHSTNIIESGSDRDTRISNDNNVNTTNENNQQATSGNATVSGNTFGGSANSGNAVNENQTENNVDVSNNDTVPATVGNGGGSAFIGTTGPHSTNVVSSNNENRFSESNTNDVNTYNSNNQSAQSGNARESGNTFGGDASSGAAYNSNSTDNETNISNN